MAAVERLVEMGIGDIEPLSWRAEREPLMRIPSSPVRDKTLRPQLEIIKDNKKPIEHAALAQVRSRRRKKRTRIRGCSAKLTFLNIY